MTFEPIFCCKLKLYKIQSAALTTIIMNHFLLLALSLHCFGCNAIAIYLSLYLVVNLNLIDGGLSFCASYTGILYTV